MNSYVVTSELNQKEAKKMVPEENNGKHGNATNKQTNVWKPKQALFN